MWRVLAVALALGGLVGCLDVTPTGPAVDKTTAALQSASNSLNGGVNSLEEIVAILEKLKSDLDDGKYKDQVQEIIGRMAQMGTLSVKASVDFVRSRVAEDLQRLLAIVSRQPLPPRVPHLDIPQSFSIDPETRDPFTVTGWNLDIAREDRKVYGVVISNPAGNRVVEPRFIKYQGEYAVTVDLSRVPLQPNDAALEFTGFNVPMEIVIRDRTKSVASREIVIRPLFIDVYYRGSGKDKWNGVLNVSKNGRLLPRQKWEVPDVTDNATHDTSKRGPDNRDSEFSRHELRSEPVMVVSVLPTDTITLSVTVQADVMDLTKKDIERKLKHAEEWAKSSPDFNGRQAYQRKAQQYRKTLAVESSVSKPLQFVSAQNWGIGRGQLEGLGAHRVGTDFGGSKPSEYPSFYYYFRIEESAVSK